MIIMKVLIFLFTVTLAVSQVPEDSANAWANIVSQHKSECICATGVDPGIVEKWLYNFGFPNNACLKCFIKCVTTRLGLLNADGSVNVPANLALISKIPGSSSNLTYFCTNQTATTADICQKSFDFSYCVQNTLANGA